MTNQEHRAPQVCSFCKKRKRACDKKLPGCGYCIQRGLPCDYNYSSVVAPAIRPPVCPILGSSILLMDTVVDWLPSQTLPIDRLLELRTADDVLHRQIYRIIQATDLPVHDISVRYFDTIHRWIPIISRGRLEGDLVSSRALDLSILLLSMCLVVYQGSSRLSAPDVKSLYLATKMMYAQAQTFFPLSTRVAQAGLLIAFFEYAHHLPETAFVTLGLCVRIVRVEAGGPVAADYNSKSFYWHRKEELRNMWWAIVIFERVLLCEISIVNHASLTKFPEFNCPLPSEAEALDQPPRTSPPPAVGSSIEHPALPLGCFGRQAQAAFLLDRAWTFVNADVLNVQSHTTMKQVDQDLWSCLGVFMEECNGLRGVSCGAMAITLRALHLLHSFILDSAILMCYRGPSDAALQSVFMISVDIASSHGHVFNKVNVDSVPPSCGYISRAALRHFESLATDTDFTDENDYDRYCGILARSIKFFDERWAVKETV